jgi:hypothetical protein
VEAFIALAVASVAVEVMPFRWIARFAAWLGAEPARDVAAHDTQVQTCSWAVEQWARRVPWKTVCFQKGLALQIMLRRRGVASKLHYGLCQDPVAGLRAHVWVSLAGEVVMGGDSAREFRCLATFPSGRSPT